MRVTQIVGTLRYGNADALKYATVEESLGQEHSVCGGKIKLRFIASDATIGDPGSLRVPDGKI